jgi:hypothetical protein
MLQCLDVTPISRSGDEGDGFPHAAPKRIRGKSSQRAQSESMIPVSDRHHGLAVCGDDLKESGDNTW